MSDAVMAALITGLLSLIGTVITVLITSRRTTEEIKISQAIMNTRIDQLTIEVRAHNKFAQRVPVVEEQIKTANRRLENLERGVS